MQSTRTWEKEGSAPERGSKRHPGDSSSWLHPCPGPHLAPVLILPWHPATDPSAEDARSVPKNDATASHGDYYFIFFLSPLQDVLRTAKLIKPGFLWAHVPRPLTHRIPPTVSSPTGED